MTKASDPEKSPTVLTKIWDGDHIEHYRDNAGEKCMKCLWCNNKSNNWHTTKQAWSLLRGKGLAVCGRAVDDCSNLTTG